MDLLVFASDFHFGRKTAGWNARRAQVTLNKLASQVASIVSDIKPNRISVLFLGDIMDGECVYPQQSYELELVGFEQVYEGASLFFQNFIQPIASLAPLTLDGVPGNHAYLRFSNRKTNLDFFFYATLEQIIREKRLQPVITKFWSRGKNDTLETKMVTCGSLRVFIGHGHFLRSVAELPFAGAQRKVLSWLATTIATPFDLAAFGHFHRWAFYAVPGNRYVLFNGCMLAHDEFSLTRYGHPGDRIWTVLAASGKRIVSVFLLRDDQLEMAGQLKTRNPWQEGIYGQGKSRHPKSDNAHSKKPPSES